MKSFSIFEPNMKRILFCLTTLLSISSFQLTAQDPIFSQTFAAPIYFNPALAGAFDASYQVSSIYRDQWRGGADAPYQTYLFNVEGKFEVSYNKTYTPDIVGVGLIFMSDNLDLFSLSTNQIQLVGSYHKALSKKSNQYLGIGFSAGIVQKSFNYDNLTFEDQFNQVDGYDLNTSEILPPNNLGFGDFSLGINYAISSSNRSRYYAGLAYHHISSPNVSFFNLVENPNPNIQSDFRLGQKLLVYLSSKHFLGEEKYILPRILFAQQLENTEITPGANFVFPVGYANEFILGAAVRVLDNIDGIKPSAAILMTAFQYKDFQFGFSYDFNIQDFSRDRQGFDAFEISIRFNGNYTNEINICPTF